MSKYTRKRKSASDYSAYHLRMKQETRLRHGQTEELPRSEIQNYTMFPTQHPQQVSQKFYEMIVQSI